MSLSERFRRFAATAGLAWGLAAGAAVAQVEHLHLRVDGMTWPLWAQGAEEALRRLEGVGHAEVDFEGARAVVEAAEGEGLDPARIAAAVEDSGFGAAELRVRARGRLARRGERPVLELPGRPGRLALEGGERLDELLAADLAEDSEVAVEGSLRLAAEGELPELAVEAWSEPQASGPGD